MSRITCTGALVAAASALALSAPGAAAGDDTVTAAGKCRLSSSQQRNLGPSYVTSLSVRGVSCRTGRSKVKTYHRNRGRVRGWSCSRRTLSNSRYQYDARVTCRRGGKRVVWTYTQNK